MGTRPAPALLLLAALVSAGCGSGQQPGPGRTGDAPVADQLVITVDDGAGGAPRTWTLTCDPPGGDHPDPAAACAALAAARAPFAPVPPDMACTQIYGGPETARIEGTWRGEPVTADYRRTDGCEIARWRALAPVFGG
jgi:hypothetical protein